MEDGQDRLSLSRLRIRTSAGDRVRVARRKVDQSCSRRIVVRRAIDERADSRCPGRGAVGTRLGVSGERGLARVVELERGDRGRVDDDLVAVDLDTTERELVGRDLANVEDDRHSRADCACRISEGLTGERAPHSNRGGRLPRS